MSCPPLACTVRDCGLSLDRRARAYVCGNGHSFDVARSGYVNLLQSQDRRSLTAGDTKAAVDARASLLSAGIGRDAVDAVAELAHDAVKQKDTPVVVDLGCGSGDALASLSRRVAVTAIGIDLSPAAAEHAARRYPGATWVVANADRRLPLLDRSVHLVLSLHGRRNPSECDRVLVTDGALLVTLPAPDDLIELREAIQGSRLERSRSEAMLAEHEPFFTLATRGAVRQTVSLEMPDLVNLLRGTYRGARHSAADRLATLGPMTVTLSSELFLLRPRR